MFVIFGIKCFGSFDEYYYCYNYCYNFIIFLGIYIYTYILAFTTLFRGAGEERVCHIKAFQ